jgi:hypothetical protein
MSDVRLSQILRYPKEQDKIVTISPPAFKKKFPPAEMMPRWPKNRQKFEKTNY